MEFKADVLSIGEKIVEVCLRRRRLSNAHARLCGADRFLSEHAASTCQPTPAGCAQDRAAHRPNSRDDRRARMLCYAGRHRPADPHGDSVYGDARSGRLLLGSRCGADGRHHHAHGFCHSWSSSHAAAHLTSFLPALPLQSPAPLALGSSPAAALTPSRRPLTRAQARASA